MSARRRRGGRGDRRGRVRLRRAVIILPSAFTLGNLFLGVFAMVSAARGEFEVAAWAIVWAALLDMLDGRIARFTATGSRFGSELDSLVDAISFGVAPGFVAYVAYFANQPWSWILSFLYITAVVLRLARFNVEQGGRAKTSFYGLPSPTAGMVLATVYPFFNAPAVVELTGGGPSPQTVGILMIVLSVLMLSHVPYPLVPRLGFRGVGATAVSLVMLAFAAVAIAIPEYSIFPFLSLYTLWGVTRSTVLGLAEKRPEEDPLIDEEPIDEASAEMRSVDYGEIAPTRYPSPEAIPPEPGTSGTRSPEPDPQHGKSQEN
jgi:CDP-diacylglycerol--serine O-phosphatidyltransferase